MPTYEVETNQGKFQVELSRPPQSAQELHDAVTAHLSQSQPKDETAWDRAGTMVKQQLPSLAGGAVGAAAGLMTGPAAPVAVPLLTGLGSAFGTAYSHLRGDMPPDSNAIADTAISGALPVLGGAMGGAAKAGRQFLPGTRTNAVNMNQIALAEGDRMVTGLRPGGVPSKHLFDLARSQNVGIPATRTMTTLDEVIGELRSMTKTASDQTSPVLAYAQDLKGKLQPRTQTMIHQTPYIHQRTVNVGGSGALNPSELQNEIAAVSDYARSLRTAGRDNAARLADKITTSLLDDLDTAAASGVAGSPAAATLQAARKKFLREKTADDVEAAFEKFSAPRKGQGGDVDLNAAGVMRELKKNPFYVRATTAAERDEIQKVLEMVNSYPALPPGSGQTAGSRNFWMGAAGVLGPGAAVGYQTGSPLTGAAVTAGLYGAGVARNLWTVVQNPSGREFLTKLFTQSKGVISPETGALIGAAANALRRGEE